MRLVGMGVFAVVLFGLVPLAFGMIRIWEDERDGQPVVIMENDLYRTVLAYTQARLPLSYVFKVTGHEECVMPETLNDDHEYFHYFGGIIDSIPSTSGADPGDRKGQLWRVPWTIRIEEAEASATFYGKAEFDYTDPSRDVVSRLAFEKTMVGYEGSSALEMRYRITNIGDTDARFMLAAHGRMGIGGGWSEGDYFYAPGDSCRLYYTNWPSIIERGVEAPCWMDWPLKEVTDYQPSDQGYHIFVYLPSDWSVLGDERFKETVFFVSSPVRVGTEVRQMRMGMFMTTGGYVIEPSLTYNGGKEGWDAPDGTVTLKPGEVCSFTLTMAAYQGMSRKEVEGRKDVRPDVVVLEKPEIRVQGRDLVLSGRIASAGSGMIVVEAPSGVLSEQKIEAGIVDLGRILRDKGKVAKVVVRLKGASGVTTLRAEN